MHLAPLLDDGRDASDFWWLEASPTSPRALGCAVKGSVGRSLKQALAKCAVRLSTTIKVTNQAAVELVLSAQRVPSQLEIEGSILTPGWISAHRHAVRGAA